MSRLRLTSSLHRALLRLVLVLAVTSLSFTVVFGGCTLEPLAPECYRCPCGTTGLVCEQGFCILQSRIDTLNPNQLDQFIAACKNRPEVGGELPPPPGDATVQDNAPPVEREDFCKGVTCPANFECDPRDGSCIQKTQCPNNEPPLADGTCPKKKASPCDTVTCVSGKRCEPTTGDCVAADCRFDLTLCTGAQCCQSTSGSCVSDCRQCNSCLAGFTCNKDSGVCESGGNPNPSCKGAALCSSASDCCGRVCIQGKAFSDTIVACECKSAADCKSGTCSSLVLSDPPGVKQACSCIQDADCAPGASCKSFLGTKFCAR